jgi:phosphate-selective porin OprO/OprP
MKKNIVQSSKSIGDESTAFIRESEATAHQIRHANMFSMTQANEYNGSDERAVGGKKNGVRTLIFTCVLLLMTPLIACAEEDYEARIKKLEADVEALKSEQGTNDFRVFWKEGLRLETPDKEFSLKVGGRIMADGTWVSEDDGIKADVGSQQDGVEFRRARLYLAGKIYGNVKYKMEFDFAGGDATFTDVYIALPDFSLGTLKVGHFREPFGLEELTSSKYITFLERVLSSADPSRNTGIMLNDSIYDKRMTWAAGVFKITDDFGALEDDGGYSATGRITGLPVYQDKGASLIHLGVAFSHRDPAHNSVQLRSKPEAHQLDYFIDTGSIPSDNADILGLESAWISGPFSLQGEYFYLDVDRTGGSSSVQFDGYYGQASYFLTGEHRRYNKSEGVFGRIKPHENYGDKGGIGAWEVAVRYSDIDLNDGSIAGGRVCNTTAGLNWYLNPNTRFMWNYIYSEKKNVGNADIFSMRAQIDF